MIELFNSCLICDGAVREIKGYEKDHLVKCKKCGFIFSKRIPTLQELKEAYNTYTRDNEISSITIKRYNDLLNQLEIFRKENNIIDVGCGDAWFLSEAKKRGWNVYGTEFDERAIVNGQSKGITMHLGQLNPSNYHNIKFDIVTSFEVVEHINNPKEEFSNFNKLLRTEGVVYVTTPNFNSLSKKLLGPKWNVLHYPEHLSYYSPATLELAFKKCGFRKVKGTTSGFSFSRFRNSIHKVESSGKVYNNNTDEKLREKLETSKIHILAKEAINNLFHMTGTGDTIKSFFKKVS